MATTANPLVDVPDFLKPLAKTTTVRVGPSDPNYAADVSLFHPNTINVHGQDQETEPVLTHEMTHVFQDSRKLPFLAHTLYDQATGKTSSDYDYGGEDDLIQDQRQGKTINNFGPEQQANMVSDYQQQTKDAIKHGNARQLDEANNAYGRYTKQLASLPARGDNSHTINTTPEPPGLPPASETGFLFPNKLLGGEARYVPEAMTHSSLNFRGPNRQADRSSGMATMHAPKTQTPDDDLSQYEVKPQTESDDDLSQYEVKPTAQPPTQPSWMQRMAGYGNTADNFGQGIGKSFTGLVTNTSDLLHKIPGVGPKLIPEGGLQTMHAYTDPTGTAQKVGRGVGDAAQFLIPGLGEEATGAKLLEAAPKLGEAAAPIARIGTQALGSGAINKLQGGKFSTGAATGLAGGIGGEGLRMAAPTLTEVAQGLNTAGRKSGRAILSETRGIFPGAIRRSAQSVLDELNPELDQAAIRAGQRPPAKIAGLLQAPKPEMEAIPLGKVPDEMLHGRTQLFPARRLPNENVVGGSPDPHNLEQLGNRSTLPPARLTRRAYTSGTVEPVEDMQRSGPGVLLRPKAAPPSGAEIPYNGISLRPARQVAQDAVDKANLQGEPKLVKGTKRLVKQLENRGDAGPRPEVVSPYEFLQTKRGVGNSLSAAKWKPGYKDPFTGVQKRIYGTMADQFHEAVPEAADLDRRISSLIPVNKSGRSLFDNGRAAIANSLLGGIGGYHRGGIKGAMEGAALGGLEGFLIPGQLNTAARLANSGKLMPLLVGSGLQFTRNK